jgi:hypothetical protein
VNGYVKLRRGLLEHLRAGRIAFTEYALYTVLIALADHRTGVYHGSQRRLAAAAGISSAQTWKLLTALEGKGYIEWSRERSAVRVVKYRPVQNPVDMSGKSSGNATAPGSAGDQRDHDANQPIRNIGTLFKKEDLASASAASSADTPTGPIRTKTKTQTTAETGSGTQAAVTSAARRTIAGGANIGTPPRRGRAPFGSPSPGRRSPASPPAPSSPDGPPSREEARTLERELRAVCRGKSLPNPGLSAGERRELLDSQQRHLFGETRAAAPPSAWLSPELLERRRRLLDRQRAQFLARPDGASPPGPLGGGDRRPPFCPSDAPPTSAATWEPAVTQDTAAGAAPSTSGRGSLRAAAPTLLSGCGTSRLSSRRASRPERSPP